MPCKEIGLIHTLLFVVIILFMHGLISEKFALIPRTLSPYDFIIFKVCWRGLLQAFVILYLNWFWAIFLGNKQSSLINIGWSQTFDLNFLSSPTGRSWGDAVQIGLRGLILDEKVRKNLLLMLLIFPSFFRFLEFNYDLLLLWWFLKYWGNLIIWTFSLKIPIKILQRSATKLWESRYCRFKDIYFVWYWILDLTTIVVFMLSFFVGVSVGMLNIKLLFIIIFNKVIKAFSRFLETKLIQQLISNKFLRHWLRFFNFLLITVCIHCF